MNRDPGKHRSSTRRLGGDELLRLLADPERLAILGRLATGPVATADLAAACGLGGRALRRQLPRLVAAGLVVPDAGMLKLDAEVLRSVVRQLPRSTPISPHLLVGLSAGDASLAARYFDGARLVEIPVGRTRRRVVLGVLVDEFEPGRYYSEAEVRRILRKFHPDDAALRRYLVEEGLLGRENATRTYWRTPGPPPAAAGPDKIAQ